MKTLVLLMALTSIPAFARDGGGSSVGTGNPAAKLCIDLGGALERYETRGGESSNCVIDEWKLYQEMGDRHLLGHIGCGGSHGAIGCANPAAVNCSQIGGKYRIVHTREGEAGYCVIDEWKLWGVFNK